MHERLTHFNCRGVSHQRQTSDIDIRDRMASEIDIRDSENGIRDRHLRDSYQR